MKQNIYSISTLLCAGLLIAASANAQWTHSGSKTTLNNKGDSVGIGTTTPTVKLDVQGTALTAMRVKSSTDNVNFILDRATSGSNSSVSYRTAGSSNWQTGCAGNNNFTIKNNMIGGTIAFYVNATTNNIGIGTNSPANRLSVGGGADFSGNVGIGTTAPAYHLEVEGNATAPTFYNVYSKVNYVGTSDIRAIEAYSHPADGWGFGVEATGGFFGGYFNGLGGTYTGSSYGVFGTASGSAGTRYGVYGSASNSGGPAWAGYFSGNTYASNLVVGGVSTPATGYTVTVGGKLIATEVRVQLTPFPDYVFAPGYNLPSISDLESSIKTNNRLPGMPSACDVEQNGLMLGEMQGKIVEKVEEQALYIIQLQKQIDELRTEIKAMKK